MSWNSPEAIGTQQTPVRSKYIMTRCHHPILVLRLLPTVTPYGWHLIPLMY